MQKPPNLSWRARTTLRIGDFVVDPVSHEISGDDQTTRLRPILMDVLLRLAAEPGAAVSRETLLNDVWPRRMVNDEVLSRAVAELRTALSDDPKAPRYIETLPKVGYRLIAPVQSAAQTPAPAPAPEPQAGPALTTANGPASEPENVAVIDRTLTSPPALAKRASWRWLSWCAIACFVALACFALYRTYARASADGPSADLVQQVNAAIPFASSPLSESSPRFSPDGASVVYVRSAEDVSEIVIQDIASGRQRSFARTGVRMASPIFTPDGRGILYWWRRPATPNSVAHGAADCAIALRDFERAADTDLVDCSDRPQPVFDVTPDGRALIYAALPRTEHPRALMRHDLASGSKVQLTAPAPGDGHDAYPRVSADGNYVAFFRGTQSHARLWTLALANPGAPGSDNTLVRNARPASPLEGLAYGVAWQPEGGGLLVAADWLGFRALNAVALADGSARLIGARGARFPDISKDGKIVYESATYRADLWLSSTAQPAALGRQRWPSTRYTNQPEFSPDGRRVVFASNRSGGDAIHIASIGEPTPGNSEDATRLPFPADARYIQPHWSADGDAVFAVQIAATADGTAVQRAVRIDLATHAVSTLSHLGQQVNNAVPLADGRDIVYGELVDHAMRLQRAAVSGGPVQRLPLPLVSSFAIVDNDLVFTQPQLTGATRCALDTFKCSPLKVPLDDGSRFDWALGKGALWYASRNAAGMAELVRFELDTAKQTTISTAPTAVGTNIAVSRDGKTVIVAREAPAVLDLMIAKPVR